MGSKEIGADVNLCWPTAEIAVLGAEGAVQIIHRKALDDARARGEDADALKQQLVDDYTKQTINANLSQQRGSVDAMISPQDTRRYILRSLDMLRNKKLTLPHKKQDNQPL
jgi:acetyl-CoA carboxylase carboxyltransferase component